VPGLDAAGVVGFGLVAFLWVGLGLPAGLPQSVELAPLALAPLVPFPLEVAWLGLAGRLAASWSRLEVSGLELAGLELGGLEVLRLAAGLVLVALGVAAGLVSVARGLADGLVLTGLGLGWALWCLPAATACVVFGEQVAPACPPPPLLCPVPFTPTAPLPGPDAPGPLVPAGPLPPIELMNAAASANICLPNGVRGETANAAMTATAATAAASCKRDRRRGCGVSVCATPERSCAGPGNNRRHACCSHTQTADRPTRTRPATSDAAAIIQATAGCSHAQNADSPIRVRLATSSGAAIIQAKGVGRGVVSRARIRSKPLSESSIGSTAE